MQPLPRPTPKDKTMADSAATVELAELVARCLALAEGAGTLIREVYETNELETRYKDAQRDPVTVADLRAQRYIQGSLARAYPTLLVIGEEDDAAVASHDDVVLNPNAGEGSQLLSSLVLPPELRTLRTADLVLWLDPLDATRSFVRPQLPSVFSSNFSDFRLSWVYLGRWIAGLPTSPP